MAVRGPASGATGFASASIDRRPARVDYDQAVQNAKRAAVDWKCSSASWYLLERPRRQLPGLPMICRFADRRFERSGTHKALYPEDTQPVALGGVDGKPPSEFFQLSTLRTEAESIAIALKTGLLDVADAVAWADRQIAAGDVPDVALCDVSMASRKYPQDVVSMLRSLPGLVNHDEAIRATMRISLDRLQSGARNPSDVARALFNLAISDDLPDGDLKRHAFCFWDEIDLARDGYVPTLKSTIVAQMMRLLEDFAKDNAQ